jgi:hypothetical protein
MTSYARKTFVTLFAGAAVIAGAGPATAAPNQFQDGLVNVAVGDVTITDAVDIGIAAQIAANFCGVKVGPSGILILGSATNTNSD